MGLNKRITPSRKKTVKKMTKTISEYRRIENIKNREKELSNNSIPAKSILNTIQQNA